MFKNLRIGAKMALGFALVVVIFAGVAWYQINAMHEMGLLQHKGADRAEEALYIQRMDSRLEHLYVLVGEAVINGNVAEVRAELEEYEAKAAKDMDHLLEMVDTPEEKADAKAFIKLYQDYIALVRDELLPLVAAQDTGVNDDIKAIDERIDELRATSMGRLDAMLASLTAEMHEADEVFDSMLVQTEFAAITISAIGLGVAVLVALLITLAITRPLKMGVAYALGIADGDIDNDLDISRRDEVGQICQALTAISLSLRKVLGEFGETVEAIDLGKLRERAHPERFNGAFARLIEGGNTVADVFTTFIDAMPLPVMNMDRDFNLLYMNQAARGLTGLKPGQFQGKKCNDVISTPDCDTENCACGKAAKRGQVEKAETTARVNGKEYIIEYTGVPITDRSGKTVGVTEIVVDLTAIRKAQRKIEKLAGQADKISTQVASASEELSAQVEQSSRGAEQQRERAAETATAMEQMNSTVLEVARNASSSAESATQAKDKALAGQEIVERAVAAITRVDELAATLKTNMGELGDKAESIGQVMNVITDIADQTNLLALNAAIEAARAGEAGRGFAVVADEVRKLAEKTMSATHEVGQAINGIQEVARTNVTSMDQAVEAVAESTELAKQSGKALEEIVALSENTADQVTAIATASEEQSAAAEQISRATEEVNRISQETSDAMNQSAQAITELASLAQELQTRIAEMQSDD